MECFLQYLDDLDDFFYAVALAGERIRRLLTLLFSFTVLILVQGLGIYLAVTHPPIAVAAGSLLLVLALFYGVVGHGREYPTAA